MDHDLDQMDLIMRRNLATIPSTAELDALLRQFEQQQNQAPKQRTNNQNS